ncbi:MAG: phosphate ABC transporter permease PstA [Candidatus Cloacimonetes bacterium]|nr:phosphate ABC transporter permease PstA [Candidatus Cloacimonadota bacterium]
MKEKNLKYRLIKDKIFFISVVLMSFVVAVPLFFILYFIFKNGFSILSIDFLTKLPAPMGELGGGVLNGLIGTLLLIIMASIMAIPLGVSVGVYLSEFKHDKFAKYVRFCAEVLQGVPSIVLGIIAYLWLVLPMKSFTALAGSVALAIMMLPIIIRSTEETLKMVPDTLKEASLSLGVPYSRTIIKVILPCAFNGIMTSVLIGVSRIAGETAPLLFTAFGSPFLNFNILKPTESLPLMIYKYASSPFPQDIEFAWGVAAVLCIFVLALNLISKGVAKKWKVQF